MPEWTITIETAPGATSSEDDLERFADALEQDSRALGAACSLNVVDGVLSSTFQVDAGSFDAAAAVARAVFVDIADNLGLPPGRLTIDVEPDQEAA